MFQLNVQRYKTDFGDIYTLQIEGSDFNSTDSSFLDAAQKLCRSISPECDFIDSDGSTLIRPDFIASLLHHAYDYIRVGTPSRPSEDVIYFSPSLQYRLFERSDWRVL